MLVLTRLRGQSVMIGDDITITVADIRGEKVRLGISAPRQVGVHRKEIYDEIKQKNIESSGLTPPDLAAILPSPGAAGDTIAPHDAPFILAALEEARKSQNAGGLPIGAVLVRNNQIIGSGYDHRIQNRDPLAHAEIECLRSAGHQSAYSDTVLYSTLMPCYLCSGAIVEFGIPQIVVGESVNFPGGQCHIAGSSCPPSPRFLRTAGVELVDLHDAQCIEMTAAFIRENPDAWNEHFRR